MAGCVVGCLAEHYPKNLISSSLKFQPHQSCSTSLSTRTPCFLHLMDKAPPMGLHSYPMISLDLSLLFLRNFGRCVTSGPDPKGGHSTHIHRSSRVRAGPCRGRICSGFDLPFASPLNRRCPDNHSSFHPFITCSFHGAPSISARTTVRCERSN